jgi:hypothetical protein
VRAPRTRFNRRIGAGRSAAFGSTSLAEIKAMKNAFGATVNDVVMTVVTGALRTWLAQRDERRLEFVHAEMDRAKRRHAAVPATLLQDANHLIPPALFGRAARASMALGTHSLMSVGTNLLVSNVPGSPVPLYLAGARLQAQYPVSAIFHNLALNITVLSYQDHMDWGIVCGEGEDAWSLLEAIYEEHQRLYRLTRSP